MTSLHLCLSGGFKTDRVARFIFFVLHFVLKLGKVTEQAEKKEQSQVQEKSAKKKGEMPV